MIQGYTQCFARNIVLIFLLLLLPTAGQAGEYGVKPQSSLTTIIGSVIGSTIGAIVVVNIVAMSILETVTTWGVLKSLVYLPAQQHARFDNVIGLEDAKDSLKDIIEYIHNPSSFRVIGAQMPRGILLSGEPGNGKTLLAKALAGEANCSLLSVNGSDFTGPLVGLGVLRVKLLFFWARRYAPCILFIDEIDALGRERGSGLNSRGWDETLNQLLTELDGFDSNKNIFVVGATNRMNDLDPALVRPGRFDRIIHIKKPTLEHRKDMLALYGKRISVDADVDFDSIARATVGYSGAEIANLVNQAALIAKRNQQKVVTNKDFDDAMQTLYLGGKVSLTLSEHDRNVTAVHEAGHVLCTLLSEKSDPLHMVTIEPRGRALGVSWSRPFKEQYMVSEEELRARIVVCMGGRAAEELIFNKKMSGAKSDFKKAYSLAEKLVCEYGMHEHVGFLACDASGNPLQFSQETKRKIEEAISSVLHQCHNKAMELLKSNRDKLALLAHTLLEKTTLMANEVYELLDIVPAHCIA